MKTERKTYNIYCDESKDNKIIIDRKNNEVWLYFGLLFVNVTDEKQIATNLNYLKREEDFIGEVTYKKANSKNIKVLKKWEKWIEDNYNKEIYYTIFGINTSKLNWANFKGDTHKGIDQNIYNRFFRMALYQAICFHFNDKDINIGTIFHDEGDMEHHKYFKTSPIRKVSSFLSTEFFDKKINFQKVREDNLTSIQSTLLQVIDLFLGATVNMLHHNSKNKYKEEISMEFYDLIYRGMYKKGNVNSRFFKKIYIKFFPLHKIDYNNLDKIENLKNYLENFYEERQMLLTFKDQLSLF